MSNPILQPAPEWLSRVIRPLSPKGEARALVAFALHKDGSVQVYQDTLGSDSMEIDGLYASIPKLLPPDMLDGSRVSKPGTPTPPEDANTGAQG